MVARRSARLSSRKKNESLSSSEPTTIDSLESTTSSEIVSTDNSHGDGEGVSEYGSTIRKSTRLQKHTTSRKYLEESESEEEVVPEIVNKRKRIEKSSKEKKPLHTKEQPSTLAYDGSLSSLQSDKTAELKLLGNDG
jgi:hypothetical protein